MVQRKRRPRISREEQTAYHEAGHAVACLLAKHRFKHVTIIPADEYLGRVLLVELGNFHPAWDWNHRIRMRIEKMIMTSLAGDIAEKKVTGRTNPQGARFDNESVVDWAINRCGSGEEATAFVHWLAIRVETALTGEKYWPAVEALARELLKSRKVGYRKARKIMIEAIIPSHMREGTMTGKKSRFVGDL